MSIIKVEQLLAAMRMEDKAEVQCGKLSEVNRYSNNLMNELDPVGSTVRYEMMKLCTGPL